MACRIFIKNKDDNNEKLCDYRKGLILFIDNNLDIFNIEYKQKLNDRLLKLLNVEWDDYITKTLLVIIAKMV